MALDESDRLSLLALIVSVVALIVSGWQLAQQLFATATDGKRFCQGSVMGIWSRKTRLSWRWSQIRFETKYTTPEIRLASSVPSELLRYENSFPDEKQVVRRRRLMYKLPLIKNLTEIFNGPASDFEGYFDITAPDAEVPWELRKSRFPRIVIRPNSATETCALWLLRLWHSSYEVEDPELITWPSLLRSLYGNQVQSVYRRSAAPSMRSDGDDSPERAEKLHSKQPQYYRGTDMSYGNHVVVRMIERSWDLMPPDVVRPLAKSTVGNVIVMAHRFGMQWQDLTPTEGRMNAAGYGHEISSETIRGLGIVLQYTFRQEAKGVRDPSALRGLMSDGEYFAPTEAGDKLHCGIVPIDDDAVQPRYDAETADIHLVDQARQIDLEGLYDRLGIQRQVLAQINQSSDRIGSGGPARHFRHCIEEAISLLCPIVPLPNAGARTIMWPLRNRAQPFTPLRQRAGVEELRDQLRKDLQAAQKLGKLFQNRQGTILEPLGKSPLEYMEDVLVTLDSSASPILASGTDLSKPTKHAASSNEGLPTFFDIHRKTSEVFRLTEQRIGQRSSIDDLDRSRPLFLDLVAAHVTMAAKYGAPADKTALEQPPPDEVDTFIGGRLRYTQELAKLYVQDIEGERAFAKHLRKKGYTLEHLKAFEVTALWWVLVLRGICWWATVRLKLPENLIPSVWYHSAMPVYIT